MPEVIRPMRQKTDTAARWASINPVLGNGEIGIDTTNRIRKTGDGVKTWTQLPSEWLQVDTCRLVRNAVLTVPNASDTLVSWDATVRDISSTGQAQGSSTGITIRKAGVYRVTAYWPWATNGSGNRNIKVLLNGTSASNCILLDGRIPSGYESANNVTDELALAAGDVIRLAVVQSSGGNLDGSTAGSLSPNVKGSLTATFVRD